MRCNELEIFFYIILIFHSNKKMTISKKIVFNSYKDVEKKEIHDYFESVLNHFQPIKKKILLFVQCSKIKPYSNSPSHKYIRKAITELTGFDPYDFPEKNPIQIIVISSLIGPVPYENESDYIPSHYNLSVNKITKAQFKEIEPVLIDRISNFLLEIKDNYDKIIFFVKNNYKIICEKVGEYTNTDFIILPISELHMIREAWVELKYTLLDLLKEKITIQPISKVLLFDVLKNVRLIENQFILNDFRRDFDLKNKSDKQINNYLLTLRKLKLIEKKNKSFRVQKQYLNFLSDNQDLTDIEKFRDYLLTYTDLSINLKYILYQIYKHSTLRNSDLINKMNINGFSINIYLEILQWLDLIKQTENFVHLTRKAKNYLNEDKYLELIDDKVRITDFI